MSEGSTPDLSRIISVIMENPKLIEEIAALAKSGEQASEPVAPKEMPVAEPRVESTAAVPTAPRSTAAVRRGELLGALKPYLSTERAKAIDSMMTIAGILDAMKAR